MCLCVVYLRGVCVLSVVIRVCVFALYVCGVCGGCVCVWCIYVFGLWCLLCECVSVWFGFVFGVRVCVLYVCV